MRVWPGLVSVMKSFYYGHETVASKQRQATLHVSQRDDLLRLTARERSTTLWLVCSVIKCAIRRARPPVLRGLARSIILHQRAKRKQLLHRDVTVVDSFSRFGSETYCEGVSTVLVSTDDHSVSYPSNSDSHSWYCSCCPGI
jgi:hypothetical protein